MKSVFTTLGKTKNQVFIIGVTYNPQHFSKSIIVDDSMEL